MIENEYLEKGVLYFAGTRRAIDARNRVKL